MNIDIRFPNITAPTAEGQMAQMQSYMHQLVQQLNWALNTIGDAQSGNTSNVVINNSNRDISPQEAENTFISSFAFVDSITSAEALCIANADTPHKAIPLKTNNLNALFFILKSPLIILFQ